MIHIHGLERLKRSGLLYRSCICRSYWICRHYIDSPTRSSMARLLSIGQTFSAEYKLMFNSSKSKLIIFCKNGVIDGSVPFCGTVLHASSAPYELHLGNQLGPCLTKEYMLRCTQNFRELIFSVPSLSSALLA